MAHDETVEEGSLDLPHPPKMPRERYESALQDLQVELVKMQQWVKDEGERIVVLFEGRDAAGKGGTIQRFTQYLNPRGARHVALPAPNDTERGQWYFQRYVAQLPTRGEIVFFDRSWYNRAGVETVMGFCSPNERELFYQQVPGFEKALVEEGIHLFKLYLVINRKEQQKRFESRRADPLKSWKLSAVDLAALDKWDDYTDAMTEMFRRTKTSPAPWMIVNSNDKRTGRINAMRHILTSVPYTSKKNKAIGQVDPTIVAPSAAVFPTW
jgi:polyphosphate kinase 2